MDRLASEGMHECFIFGPEGNVGIVAAPIFRFPSLRTLHGRGPLASLLHGPRCRHGKIYRYGRFRPLGNRGNRSFQRTFSSVIGLFAYFVTDIFVR